MKKKIPIGLLGLSLLILPELAVGQQVMDASALNGLKISEVAFKGTIEDSLLLDMKLSTAEMKLGKMDRVTITPLLMDDAGNTYTFSSFFVDGKIRARATYRDALLRNKTVSRKDFETTEYIYKERLSLAPWMKHSKLVLKAVCDCCGKNAPGSLATVKDSLTFDLPAQRYVMHPQSNFITPEAEPIKRRMESGNAKLEFLTGKSDILPTYKNNKAELEKIGQVITNVLADSTAKVDLILLKAYSSPEGSYVANTRLSAARSAALKSYLETAYMLKGIRIESTSVPEDWDTLENMIRDSDIPQKQQFLDIIAKNTDFDRREKLFKTVAKGVPYRTMLTNLFPLLRRTDYQLSYSVKDFTVEQGREVIKTRPGQLSLNEMFHVANSYEMGSEEFRNVFDVAVQMFPEDPVANINAGAVALMRSDTLSATKYLLRVKEDPRAQNNLAVLYMLKGDLKQADYYLKQSAKATEGLKEAIHNRLELTRKEQDNALFDKYTKK